MISMICHVIHFQLNSDTSYGDTHPCKLYNHCQLLQIITSKRKNSCKELKFNIKLWLSLFCKYINWLHF